MAGGRRLLRRVLDEYPENSVEVPWAHRLLGGAFRREGRFGDAAGHLRACIETADRFGVPPPSDVPMLLVDVLIEDKRIDEAASLWPNVLANEFIPTLAQAMRMSRISTTSLRRSCCRHSAIAVGHDGRHEPPSRTPTRHGPSSASIPRWSCSVRRRGSAVSPARCRRRPLSRRTGCVRRYRGGRPRDQTPTYAARCSPVRVERAATRSAGVPSKVIRPPSWPAPGPRSMIQSACAMTA